MPAAFTLAPGVLQAAVSTLTAADTALSTEIAAAGAATSAVVAPGADTVSLAQALAVTAWGATIQTALANGESYAAQFLTNLSSASDTYGFTEAASAADASLDASGAGSGGIIDFISQLLGGPVGSVNGEPLSLSSNAANILNIGGGNFASAASNLVGMAGGGLLPAGSDTIGDAAASAALASSTTPVSGMGMGGMGMGGVGAMPMAAMGQGTLVGQMSVPPTWAGGQVTPVTGTSTSPLRTVGWTAAAPQTGAGTFIPGMPGMGGAGRGSAGFGAPRYGVKPIVMPKLASV